jgi:hypothetical protein
VEERKYIVKNTGEKTTISGEVVDIRANEDGTATMLVGQNPDTEGKNKTLLSVRYVPGGSVLEVNKKGVASKDNLP